MIDIFLIMSGLPELIADCASGAYVSGKGFWERTSTKEVRVSTGCWAGGASLLGALPNALLIIRHMCCSPDYIASCCNEAGMKREALAGKKPHLWLVSAADPDNAALVRLHGTCIGQAASCFFACMDHAFVHACNVLLTCMDQP